MCFFSKQIIAENGSPAVGLSKLKNKQCFCTSYDYFLLKPVGLHFAMIELIFEGKGDLR
jgi:hypothetical protein